MSDGEGECELSEPELSLFYSPFLNPFQCGESGCARHYLAERILLRFCEKPETSLYCCTHSENIIFGRRRNALIKKEKRTGEIHSVVRL